MTSATGPWVLIAEDGGYACECWQWDFCFSWAWSGFLSMEACYNLNNSVPIDNNVYLLIQDEISSRSF